MSVSDYVLPETAPEPALGERGLPASIDAERTILGAILLDNAAFYDAGELSSIDFALDSHQRIFAAAASLMDAGSAVDIVTLAEELQSRRETQAVGGVAYIASLTEGLPRRLSIAEYIRIVRDKSILRRVIHTCSQAITRAVDQTHTGAEVLQFLDTEAQQILGTRKSAKTVSEQVHEEFSLILRQRSGELGVFIPSGNLMLDSRLGGFALGELTVIGGRPGQGKTSALVQAILANCPMGNFCHVFSVEMSAGQLLRKVWCALANVPYHKLRHPQRMSSAELEDVRLARDTVARWPLLIEDCANVTASDIVFQARAVRRKHNTKLLGVDYLQRLHFPGRSSERFQAVTDAAKSLAVLTKTEQVAGVLLSSVSEKSGSHRNSPPTLHDLRFSGDIQYEASTVVLIHRETDERTEEPGESGQFIVAKARYDASGAFDVRFNKNTLLFE